MTTILIIDDETALRDEVQEWLMLEGYFAIGKSNGQEGLDYALHNPPDMVICDITMPRLDGHGVLLEMRANPSTASTPFVFITARAAHEDIRTGMGLGADDYLPKPFTRLELLKVVETRLEKHALQEQLHQAKVHQLQQALNEEYEQRMLKAKLVGMFSHDFRNPLSTILSSNGLLRNYSDRMDNERRTTHFTRIEASVRQLIQMLDDMLIVAQMGSDNLTVKPEEVFVGDFLQGLIEEFQAIHADTHQVMFENNFSGSMKTDLRLIRQIASNLISNAVKYSPRGGGVRISLDRYDSTCELIVQDEGVGIPEEDQKTLFNVFQRGSNVGDISGTGLGLAIVKQAADLLNASLRFESEVGKGTTMIVSIPV